MSVDDDILSPEAAARLLGVRTKTLQRWRMRPRRPLPCHVISAGGHGGGSLYYLKSELLRWVAQHPDQIGTVKRGKVKNKARTRA